MRRSEVDMRQCDGATVERLQVEADPLPINSDLLGGKATDAPGAELCGDASDDRRLADARRPRQE